ncbi:MAG TPA: hypothetical protein VLK84_18565 [Longimicrobium sp.]|nr:hypothetical protein [Longimicrobium sp.]
MIKQISALLALTALASLTACGTTPTTSETAAPGDVRASSAPADSSTSRVPNLFGSGN